LIQRRTIHIIFSLVFIVLIVSGPFVFGNGTPATVKNIEFVNADLRDVFRILAAAGKFNVIMEPRVHGNVTLALRNGVTVKDAVSVIAKTYGYSCRWLTDSSTALVGSSRFIQINFDHKISKTYPLKYASPQEIAASLEVVIPKNRIKADTQNKQIVVLANEIEIANITEIIGKLDREFQPIDLEVQLVEVPTGVWNKLGVTNNYQPPHMGVYVLKDEQKKMIEGMVPSEMVKLNFSGLDNHLLRIFLGDKVSLITTKKRKGDLNYQVEYVDAGTSLLMTPQINPEHQLTLMTKAVVTTIANKSQPGAKWVPWVVTRDFESTIRLEVGQTFILSGLLQENEYQMMKKSPYRFPELDKLFVSQKSAEQAGTASSGELIALLTPRLAEKNSSPEIKTPENISTLAGTGKQGAEGSDDTGNNSSNGSNQAQDKPFDPAAPGLEGKLPINEDKPDIKITLDATKTDSGEVKEKPEGTPISSKESGILNTQFVEIHYHVKKGDTLTNIVKKFAANMELVLTKNNLDKNGVMKEGLVVIVPVPVERTYVLKPKETLWRIAKRYGTTLEVLKDLNGISDETKVIAGEIIVLPCAQTKIINRQF
jgi:LysM repeat protein